LNKVTLPDSASLSYTYDDAHRLRQLQDSLGNRIVYTLDLIGNRTKDEVFDPAASLVQKREREYNSLSRLIKDIGATNPATQITQYGYDNQGNLTTIDGPLPGTLDVTINLYDALNRLRQVTDPGQGITRYGLNALDQLTSVTDPRNNVTTYSLDGLNNLNSQTSPDTGATVNSFDDAGNLLTSRDAKNQTTTYQYDALNRVTRVTYHDGSQVQYGYDAGVYGIGRLSSISEAAPGGAMTIQALYAYDLHGRLASETRFIGAQAFVTQYGYDSAGRLNLLTYPSGRQVAYRFDALGRIAGITTTPLGGTTQSVISAVSYQPFGGVTGFTYGNGQHYTRTIDLDGRIAGYSLGNAGYGVGFDAASRIRSIINSGNAADARTFDYDVLDRLTSTTTPSTAFGFNYDANGNRTLHSVGLASWTHTYPSTSNRLASIIGGGSRTYLEDANGSVTSDGTNGLNYDARGRLT
jgi:YD repeat-containing protein